mmetsp:Transcript_36930/g.96721  ORF Transcript_36930/g.96721 Transcript_36930/m.96721 type:complete len:224 (+) Transcript_36930:289-960(+)
MALCDDHPLKKLVKVVDGEVKERERDDFIRHLDLERSLRWRRVHRDGALLHHLQFEGDRIAAADCRSKLIRHLLHKQIEACRLLPVIVSPGDRWQGPRCGPASENLQHILWFLPGGRCASTVGDEEDEVISMLVRVDEEGFEEVRPGGGGGTGESSFAFGTNGLEQLVKLHRSFHCRPDAPSGCSCGCSTAFTAPPHSPCCSPSSFAVTKGVGYMERGSLFWG